jgi:hypothetical protein
MTPSPGSPMRLTALAIAALLFAACDSGPSESEYVQACLKEGGANNLAMTKGMDREKVCKCSASAAKSALSADGYRLMVLEMQGKRQEVAALHAKMSEADKMGVMQAMLNSLGKCAGM